MVTKVVVTDETGEVMAEARVPWILGAERTIVTDQTLYLMRKDVKSAESAMELAEKEARWQAGIR